MIQVHNIPLYSDGSIPPGFVIIENPPEQDADGKLVRNLAVASISPPDNAPNADAPTIADASANPEDPASPPASQVGNTSKRIHEMFEQK